jgi:hypothetical protein
MGKVKKELLVESAVGVQKLVEAERRSRLAGLLRFYIFGSAEACFCSFKLDLIFTIFLHFF